MKVNSDRLIELFGQAMEKELPAERARFLAEVCQGEPELRQQLEALLRSHEEAGSFLRNVPAAAIPDTPLEGIGDRIGRYKLLQKIGEGGCGVVYLAEQEEPVRRRVALKVIKLGMDTKGVIARFEAERQALAMMDHPNIARIHDAGATETGRPYFVMELVRGVKITDYCDQNNLPTAQRLALFTQVCQAIQHAHQKGVIHRDIKPSNILVTVNDGVAVPKVIDFGIAKATQQRLTDKTLFTAFEQFLGTPAYMSPEQAVMTSVDIDTRSDIYSLGVLLYELLTGRTAFDTRELLKAGLDEMRRTIREVEPQRPSTCLSTMLDADLTAIAKRRQAEPAKLATLIRGDLDWIVMKCLEKDRSRRYETANGLGMDIQRHLNNEPIVARPPSQLYRFQKFARRNKLAFAAVAISATVLVVGVCVSTSEAIRAARARAAEAGERERAERNAEQARKYLYASDMNLAQQALEAGNLGRALELLERHRPAGKSEVRNPKSEPDLRGFEWRYLWRRCQGDEVATLRGHSSTVTCVAFSPDGRLLASSSQDETVRLWDVASRRALRVLTDHGGASYSAAFSPDGGRLIVGGDAGVTLWDTHDWQVKERFAGKYHSVALTRDGKTLVAGTVGRVTVLATAQGTAPYDLALASGPVVFSPDEQFMATLGRDGLYLWSLPSLSPSAVPSRTLLLPNSHFPYFLRTIPQPDNAFVHFSGEHELAFSADGQTIGLGDAEGRVMLFDLASGHQLPAFAEHSGCINTLVFSPDGKTLATASSDQTVKLWDVAAKTHLATLRGHRSEVWPAAFSPAGQTLATGSNDRTVKIWNAAPPKPDDDLQLGGQFSWISDDGSTVASWDVGNRVEFLNIATKELIESVPMPTGTMCWNISGDGNTLVLGTHLGQAQIWNRQTKTLSAPFATQPNPAYPQIHATRDGGVLVLYIPEGGLRLWSLPDGHELHSLTNAGRPVKLLNDLVAARNSNYGLTLFNFKTGQEILTLKGHEAGIEAVAFSPDGQTVATASGDGTARLWDATTSRETAVLHGHKEGLFAIDFSPDGRTLATGSGDNTVKLWNVATRQEVLTLQPHLGDIVKLKFVPDGSALITIGGSGKLKVWNAPTFEETHSASRQ